MTLRRSIIFSVAAHMLLFGTALAFARYAGGLFLQRGEPIMVSLVGRDSAANHGSGKSRKTQTAKKTTAAVLERRAANEANDTGTKQQASEGGSIAEDESGESQAPASNDGQGSRAAGSPDGAVSSEQWAVIVSSIEQVKSYPRLARERGIQGTVRVRFRLKPQGHVDTVEIVKSSGYDILDTASVRTVYRAGPMPYVSGWIEVPIAYILK
jgi:TonB family protein